MNIRNVLDRADKPDGGLYPNYVNTKTGRFGVAYVSLGAMGDSFYEYLFKTWLLSGKRDADAKRLFDAAMSAIERKLLQKSQGGLLYAAQYRRGKLLHQMDHLSCFAGGLFALASPHASDPAHYLDLGRGLTETCRESYRRTATGLGPELFRFDLGAALEARASAAAQKVYYLRPEVIESYFVLWRMTKEEKYRDWAWEATEVCGQKPRSCLKT